MSDKLFNTGATVEFVPVVAPDGSVEHVSLQPGGRLPLPIGYKVQSEWLAINSGNRKVLLNDKPLHAQGE